MKKFIAIFLFLLSGCAPTVQLQGIKLVGMDCEAVEVRTSPLMTLGALACVKPNGETTNLVGGSGKPWIEIPAQAVGMAVTVGSGIAVGQALKQINTGGSVTIVTP